MSDLSAQPSTEHSDLIRRGTVPAITRVTAPEQVFFLGDRETFTLSDRIGTTIVKDRAVLWDPNVPLVVVVSSGKNLVQLDNLREQNRPISAVIAWRLKEELVPRLLAMGIPVLFGVPTAEELLAAVNDKQSNVDLDVERERAARLAAREAMFERPAMTRA